MGTGNVYELLLLRYSNNCILLFFADAFAVAKETPKIAFAPSLDLFSVPSRLINKLSMAF